MAKRYILPKYQSSNGSAQLDLERFALALRALGSCGLSLSTAAKLMGVAPNTLVVWVRKEPILKEEYERGKANLQKALTDEMFRAAREDSRVLCKLFDRYCGKNPFEDMDRDQAIELAKEFLAQEEEAMALLSPGQNVDVIPTQAALNSIMVTSETLPQLCSTAESLLDTYRPAEPQKTLEAPDSDDIE